MKIGYKKSVLQQHLSAVALTIIRKGKFSQELIEYFIAACTIESEPIINYST